MRIVSLWLLAMRMEWMLLQGLVFGLLYMKTARADASGFTNDSHNGSGDDTISTVTRLHSFCVHIWSVKTRCLFIWEHTYLDRTDNIKFIFQLKLNRTMPWKTWHLNTTSKVIYFNALSNIIRIKVRAEVNSKRSGLKKTIDLSEAAPLRQTGLQHKPELVLSRTPTNEPQGDDQSDVISSIAATAAISTCAVIVTIPLVLSIILGIKHIVRGNITEIKLRALKKRTEKWSRKDNKRNQEGEEQFQESHV